MSKSPPYDLGVTPRSVTPPLGRRVIDDNGRIFLQVTLADLHRVFPTGILARPEAKGKLEYRLFVKPAPEQAALWSMWATRVRLEHAGRVAPFSFGWGLRTAAGWETIG